MLFQIFVGALALWVLVSALLNWPQRITYARLDDLREMTRDVREGE